MKTTRNWKLVITLGVIAVAGALVGCGSDQPTYTKEQEDALRHPQKDPNYKPPSQADLQKEQQSIAAFQQKHSHDKVEFTTTH